jgi:hypothetical protein
MNERDVEYRTTVQDQHWREEEFQWTRVLATGNAARGMVLLYLQKACTAFHEFEPAFEANALDESRLDLFRGRLANRLRQLLTTMRNNDLDRLDGAARLEEILQATESAPTMIALAELTEELHATGHTLLDALEAS